MKVEKPSTQFDLAVVARAYRESANLRVLERPWVRGRHAVVLFSSNGLYFPNTEAEASRVLVDQDRFEWRHTLPVNCRRIILVRDVYKTWYLRGISPALPDPWALAERLRADLEGWDIQMAGVSSGGFAAVLFGCLLQARRVFTLAGQFSLQPVLENAREQVLNPEVGKATHEPALNACLDVRRHFHSEMPEVYYVVPRRSSVDKLQLQLVENDPRIRTLILDSDQHDANLLRPALRRIFNRSSAYLDGLIQRTPPQGWESVELSRRLAGNSRHFSYLLHRRRDLLCR